MYVKQVSSDAAQLQGTLERSDIQGGNAEAFRCSCTHSQGLLLFSFFFFAENFKNIGKVPCKTLSIIAIYLL